MQPSNQPAPLDLETLGLPLGPEHSCPYIAGNTAQERACMVSSLGAGIYRQLMDKGWRRSGKILYKPFCPSCQKCQTIRIPVNEFTPSKSQRRVLRRNEDVRTTLATPKATDEKFDLFVRYQRARHDGTMCTIRKEYEDFLYQSPLRSVEMEFHLRGKYLGSAIMDADAKSLSAVYNYFDPDFPERSLGTYAILKSIEFAQDRRDDYYYMGYYIKESAKMAYKTSYRPYEILTENRFWT